MEYDADTLRDMQTILSYVENLIESQFREIPEERKEKVLDILERPDRYYVEGDTLLIHASNAILEKFPGDIKEDIPFDPRAGTDTSALYRAESYTLYKIFLQKREYYHYRQY